MGRLLEIWLGSAVVVWMSLGAALYFDLNRSEIRKTCADWRILGLKISLAPLTLAYVLLAIAVYPILALWNNFAIGCIVGRRKPKSFWGQSPKAQIDKVRVMTALDAGMQISSPCCGDAFLRNDMALRKGPTEFVKTRILIQDEHADRYAPPSDEDEPPNTIYIDGIPHQKT